MPHRNEPLTDAALLDALVKACVRRGEALEVGDTDTANAQFDLGARLSRELPARGQPAKDGILSLLLSENPHVRLHAAFVALEIDPSRAERVLRQIGRAYKDLNLGFSARFTLQQWQTGKLRTISWDIE